MKCEDCRWFNDASLTKTALNGECRRFPPSGPHRFGRSGNDFPMVDKRTGWCGEFQQRPVETAIEF